MLSSQGVGMLAVDSRSQPYLVNHDEDLIVKPRCGSRMV